MKKILAATTACLLGLIGFSQTKEDAFKVQTGVQITSTPVYSISGTDTAFVNSLVLAPYLRAFHRSGLGITYSPYFVTSGSKPGLYMQTVSAGYEQYEKANVNLEFNYNHFFFAQNSSIPFSPLNNELYAFINFKKPWLSPVISSSFGFGKDESGQMQNGLNMAAGFMHSFEIKGPSDAFNIELDPSVLLNGSANPYYSFLHGSKYITHSKNYQSYLKNKNNRGTGNSTGGTTTITTTKVNHSFSLENLELGWYSSFSTGNFEVIPSGSLFLPFNKNNTTSGYWDIKLAYNF